jgi:hypothetical protein
MSNQLSEFFEADEGIPEALETSYEPVVETSEEYGYIEPSTDVPAPDDISEQNPGYVNGAHT